MREGEGRLAGKAVVIAGGAAGTGEAISRRLAAEGASVLIGDIDLEGAERLATDIGAAGGTASAFRFDNQDGDSVAALVEEAPRRYGRLDGLHVIAGNPGAMQGDGDVLAIERDVWLSQMQAHLFAPARAARSAIPLMRDTGGGSIIFTSSNAARGAGPTMIGYQTAKSGVETLTRHIAAAFGKEGIRCNCFSYGMILTENARRSLPEAFKDATLKRTWSPRLGEPRDVAGMAALLHSDEGEWITGQVIDINGGAAIRA